MVHFLLSRVTQAVRSRASRARHRLRRGIHLSYFQNRRRKWNPPGRRFDFLILSLLLVSVVIELLF